MTAIALLIALGSFSTCIAELLPFFKQCPRFDASFEDCVLKQYQDAYPYLVEGDPQYHVPVLDPLHEDEMQLQRGSNVFGITVEITNATITGLRDATVNMAKVDLEKGHAVYGGHVPEMNITSDYFLSGRLLGFFSVNASGDDSIMLKDVNATLVLDYANRNGTSADGADHLFIDMKSITAHLDIGEADMQFNNLFHGNQALEKQANLFIARNWRGIFNIFEESLNKVIGDAFGKIVTDANEYLPLDEMYPFQNGP